MRESPENAIYEKKWHKLKSRIAFGSAILAVVIALLLSSNAKAFALSFWDKKEPLTFEQIISGQENLTNEAAKTLIENIIQESNLLKEDSREKGSAEGVFGTKQGQEHIQKHKDREADVKRLESVSPRDLVGLILKELYERENPPSCVGK